MNPLEHLAERVKGEPFFFAMPLHEYACREHLTDGALAEKLGVTLDQLLSLRLCGRPRHLADLDIIIARFGGDRALLAGIAGIALEEPHG